MASFFLRCACKAAVKHLVNLFSFGVGGDLIIDLYDSWHREKDVEVRRTDLQVLANSSFADIRNEAQQVVAQEAANVSPEQQQQLVDYLAQVPASIRRVTRRPSDPSGKTMTVELLPKNAEQLATLLPPRLPRFKPGDWPLAGFDLQLEELLGVGGFGEVWKARNPMTGQVHALKFCLDQTARARLLQHEAAVVAQVQRQVRHRGIVKLEHTALRADPPFLLYEYVEGGDLAGLLREWHQQGKATPKNVNTIVLHLARIIARAHALEPPVVHRDLKPANILVTNEDGKLSLHITDFGIGGVAARQALDEVQRATRPTGLLPTQLAGTHTPLYASPQQQRGSAPDPRDDVYSLGVLWYQALFGTLDVPPPLGEGWKRRLREKGMPDPALTVLIECLEGETEDRLANAGVLAQHLEAALQPPRTESATPATAPVVKPVPAPVVTPVVGRSATREIVNSLEMRFALIPPGSFLMGSPDSEEGKSSDEGPQHEVEISRPFYMGVHTVTQGQYERLMGTNPSRQKHGPDHPVEFVPWEEAVEFCKKLGDLPEEKKAGRTYRLPTEAEWEYACRAGTTTPFHFGSTLSGTEANCNGENPYGTSEKGPYRGRTTPVGSYPPNAWGLYDCHGNVWEWTADWYEWGAYRNSARQDPTGPATGTYRVFRGGCWVNNAQHCRASYRSWYLSDSHRYSNLGFRVVLQVS